MIVGCRLFLGLHRGWELHERSALKSSHDEEVTQSVTIFSGQAIVSI